MTGQQYLKRSAFNSSARYIQPPLPKLDNFPKLIMRLFSTTYIIFSIVATAFAGFDPGSKANLAVYWGQNSAGKQETQTRLSTYCANPDIDIILIAFLIAVNNGTAPELNLANQGYNCTGSPNPSVCLEVEADIKGCQKQNKTVLLSMGGANTPTEKGFDDVKSAADGATRVWDMFGPSDPTKAVFRPFGSTSVDRFDLAFEHSVNNKDVFGQQLRNYIDKHNTEPGDQRMYLSAAPMCASYRPRIPIRCQTSQLLTWRLCSSTTIRHATIR